MSTTVHRPRRRSSATQPPVETSERGAPDETSERGALENRPSAGLGRAERPGAQHAETERTETRRRALAQALVAFGQTLPLVAAGALILVYVIWISLQMGARADKGDTLLVAILAGCVIGALAAVAGVAMGAPRRGRR